MRKLMFVCLLFVSCAWEDDTSIGRSQEPLSYNYFYGTYGNDSIFVGKCYVNWQYIYCACVNGTWVNRSEIDEDPDLDYVNVDVYSGTDFVWTPSTTLLLNCNGTSRNLYPLNAVFGCPTITFDVMDDDATGTKVFTGGPCGEVMSCQGNQNRCTMYGADGGDWLIGGSGNDLLHGGAGIDQLIGHYGHDVFWGDSGNDYLGAPGADEDGWDCFDDQTVYYMRGGDGYDGQTDTDPLWPEVEVRVTSCPIPSP